ncbi:MAG: hypothetical protein M1814_001222 [Vezdaea aestivalis]|nr:MAG: hypothetical protein M1814_001222 [Vezdaea aestivalis]
MDQELYGPFTSLETSLTSLIESITAYNPSISAVESLTTANDELSQALQRLQTHQLNHQTLLNLHSCSADLSAQIKDTLSTLASLRKDLLDLPLSTTDSTATEDGEQAARRVDPTQLLAYATHIARTSVPPSAAIRDVRAQTNGEGGPRLANGNEEGVAALSFEEKEEMERSRKEREGKWVPWPDEGVIRAGALAALENGDGGAGEGAADEAQGDDQLIKREEENGIREQVGVRSVEEKPKVFGGLDLYDPDDD